MDRGKVMKFIEISVDDAIDILKHAKGQTVLVAVQDLNTDEPAEFHKSSKEIEQREIEKAETIASGKEEYIRYLNLFSEKQCDLKHLSPRGVKRIILLQE